MQEWELQVVIGQRHKCPQFIREILGADLARIVMCFSSQLCAETFAVSVISGPCEVLTSRFLDRVATSKFLNATQIGGQLVFNICGKQQDILFVRIPSDTFQVIVFFPLIGGYLQVLGDGTARVCENFDEVTKLYPSFIGSSQDFKICTKDEFVFGFKRDIFRRMKLGFHTEREIQSAVYMRLNGMRNLIPLTDQVQTLEPKPQVEREIRVFSAHGNPTTTMISAILLSGIKLVGIAILPPGFKYEPYTPVYGRTYSQIGNMLDMQQDASGYPGMGLVSTFNLQDEEESKVCKPYHANERRDYEGQCNLSDGSLFNICRTEEIGLKTGLGKQGPLLIMKSVDFPVGRTIGTPAYRNQMTICILLGYEGREAVFMSIGGVLRLLGETKVRLSESS